MRFDKDFFTKDLDEEHVRKVFQIILLALIVIIAFANIETIYAYDQKDLYTLVQFLEIKHIGYLWASLILLFLFLVFLFGNVFGASCVYLSISFVLGVVERYFRLSRGTFLTLGEIKNYKEALGVEHSYENVICSYIIILAVINIAAIIICYKLKYPSLNRRENKKLLCIRMLSIVLTVTGYAVIYMLMIRNIYVHALIFNENLGAFVSLNESFFEPYYSDYAEDMMDEIVATYNSDTKEKKEGIRKPNIIVIMSEAFWDPNNFVDYIKCDENSMECFDELSESAISGECAVDIWGGGTIVSEWEFNTGCYKGNPYGIPLEYYEFEKYKYSTLASYLSKLGYYTMAFHGYDGQYYGRNIVYPNMGFDEFYDYKEFKHNSTYNGYISDESMVEEIEYRYEELRREHKDSPVYIFSVSIQNHIFDLEERGRDDMDPENEIHVSIEHDDVSEEGREKLEKFINGIALSNKALVELTEYFNKCEEDTMIIMFGDHAPSIVELGPDIYKEEHKYKTPYIIWTNYNNDYYYPGDINLSYLSTIMLDYLNMPDTMLTRKNKYMMKRYKINTLYEKASSYLDEKQKEEYALDMYNEKILYSYYNKKHKSNAYMWDLE